MPWPEIYSFIARLSLFGSHFLVSSSILVLLRWACILCKEVVSDGWFVLSFNVFGRFVCWPTTSTYLASLGLRFFVCVPLSSSFIFGGLECNFRTPRCKIDQHNIMKWLACCHKTTPLDSTPRGLCALLVSNIFHYLFDKQIQTTIWTFTFERQARKTCTQQAHSKVFRQTTMVRNIHAQNQFDTCNTHNSHVLLDPERSDSGQ